MKRGIISILIALFVLFGFSGVVSAEGNLRANIERVSTGDDARGHFDTYQVYFEPLDHDIGINVVSFKLILNNVTVSSDDFSIGQNWYLDSKNDTTHEYVFGSTDERMSVARHIIVTLKAYRINSAQECGLTLQINNPSYHTCEYYHGVYFGKTGTIVDAITYNIECLPHTCEKIVNGNSSTYFDENGDVTDEITYRQQCETNICVKVGSKYYGKNGNEVSYSTFNAECMPHACEKIVNGNTTTYYDADGNTTNETTYRQQCETNICVKVGDKYFDKSGNVVQTVEEFNASCMPKCEYKNNKYYDDAGNEVSEEVFNQKCSKHICEKVGNKYYDANGKETTEAKYTEACTVPKCGEKNGKYYDKDGNPISKSTYEDICLKHEACSKTKDGKFYDKAGKPVTRAEYNKQCVPVDNPKTGLVLPIMISGTVLIASYIIYIGIKKKDRFI